MINKEIDMQIKRRVEKIEKNIMPEDPIKGARAAVLVLFEMGFCNKGDIEAMTQKYAKAGITLEKILEDVNGATRGLPRKTFARNSISSS